MLRDSDPDDPVRDDEFPDDDDLVDGNDPAIAPCPACGRSMLEDSPRCPHCGNWVASARRAPRGNLWGLIVAALIAVILVIWHGLR
ncbi:MAG: hypothetical protein U1A27_05210 [Phycisphaerae bacterium]